MAMVTEHRMRFAERTLASVRTECLCGWKAEVSGENRQERLNKLVADHIANPLLSSVITSLVALKPIKDATRDGREVLCTDGKVWRVCLPKAFQPDVWEYFRDEQHAPGHTWSMVPTHFIALEDLPQVQRET